MTKRPPRTPRTRSIRHMPMLVCPACEKSFRAVVYHSRFCSKACNNTFQNRAKRRGAKLYNAAMRWRQERKEGSFSEMTFLLDNWIDADKRGTSEVKV